ncbi:MAG: winged helix-turn-helix transcriptional regulator [Hyphomicrobiales bacterium]|nr:winged helix-turn-helix transcriptional regulator [Hyphomicrobiales bacterium]MCP4999939.1 winged helix-turn-helix transcriptional regulator [Hyphomicrobiales bacterium]
MTEDDTDKDIATAGMSAFAPYLMNRVIHRYNQTLLAKMNEMGLSVTKMRALAALAAQDGLTVNELTVYAVTEQSTMSRTLDQMARDGLIVRRVSESDSRARHSSLTEAGWEAYRNIWPEMRKAERALFEGVPPQDYDVLLKVLNHMLENIRVHKF